MKRTFAYILAALGAVALFGGLVHAVLVAAHVSEPAAITVYGLTVRRLWATIEAAARIDAPPEEKGKARELKGAATWAKQFIALARGFRFVQPALIDGSPGLIFAPQGKLSKTMIFTLANAKVTRVEVVADPARLRAFDVAML